MIRKILAWLDNNLMAVLAGFLLVFIPLYPKWPLFDILPGYNVRVRLEDFLVAFTLFVFLVQIVRKKIAFPKILPAKTILVYLSVGFLSMLAAIFVVHSVPFIFVHIEKTFLHWLRRIEYFSLFFIFVVSVKSLRAVKTYFWLLIFTLIAVIIYGYGQKYLYWPAFSTMNREFAKGWWLYLTEHARVLSTFGGHYDLAAYLVITLSLGWSFLFGSSRKLVKFLVFLIIAAGFWLLILTASRSSFVAYLLGVSVVIFFWMFRRGLGWAISRWLIFIFFSLFIMLSFGDLSDRYAHIFRIAERTKGLREILLRPTATPPKNNAAFLENNLAAVTSLSDVPPSPSRPADVGSNLPPLLVPEKTASGSTVLVTKARQYSQNALLFDLSAGIRLDATWPRAIAGFRADPVLGSGYATLTKTSTNEFTEAESTDNDYLRSLGETGFLGFVTFFGTISIMIVLAIRALGGLKSNFLFGLTTGFIGLSVGLLANALLLDLFEASKVAYSFWAVAGLTMGTLYLFRDNIKENYEPLRLNFSWPDFFLKVRNFLRSDKFWIVVLMALTVSLRFYKFDGPIADWHSWRQADTSAVTRDFVKNQKINWLYPTFEDLSSVPSGLPNPRGLRLVEFPLYNAASAILRDFLPELSVEEAGRVVTAVASGLSVLFLFLICQKIISRKAAYLAALAYAVIPYSIYYGRTILPDPTMVTLSLGAIWFTLEYLSSQKKRYFVISLVLATMALLVKPFAVFLLLPIFYLWFVHFGFNIKKLTALLLYWFIASLPLLLWRFWISHFPEGVPASDWLYNGNGIRFKGAFWYWLFADRIGRLMLGYWGLIPLGFGLVRKTEGKYRLFSLFFFLSSLLYLFVFATGNVQHDYYQILLIPSLSILVGLGLDFLIFSAPKLTQLTKLTIPLGVISFVFMLAFGWYFVKDYYNINHPEIVAAGQKLQEITSGKYEQALVIAPYDGDTAFLYQTNHKGWPIMEGTIDDMIKRGADYYVSVRFDDLTKSLLANSETKENRAKLLAKNPFYVPKKYTLLSYTDTYVIIQLVPDSKLPEN